MMNGQVFHWRRPALWLCIPVVIVLIAGVWFASREFMASRRYEATLQTLRDNSRPVSNRDLQTIYEAGTHRDATRLWNRALFLVNSLAQSPAAKIGQLEPHITPGGSWEHEEEVQRLVEKARPALDLLHEAAQKPGPVWQPIEFDGFNTALWPIQNASYATDMLALEAEDALWSGDGDRAMRAIIDIFDTAETFNLPLFMVSQHLGNYMHSRAYSLIRRGLSADVWSEEHLNALSDFVSQPIDISQSWTQMVDGDVGAMIAGLDEEDTEVRPVDQAMLRWLATLPSGKEAAVDQLLAFRDCPTDDLGRFREELGELSSSQDTLLLRAVHRDYLNIQWYENIGYGLTQAEDERRLAATSLAIKKYQLANGRWPNELTQLVTEGLPRHCLTSVDKQSFGYETKDGIAYTWKYRYLDGINIFKHGKAIPVQRPTNYIKTELSSTVTIPVTTIR